MGEATKAQDLPVIQVRRDRYPGSDCCRLGGCLGRAVDDLVLRNRHTRVCRECGDVLVSCGVPEWIDPNRRE